MKYLFLFAAATVICIGGAASANTIIFGAPTDALPDAEPYAGFGEVVAGEPLEFDLVDSSHNDLIITETSIQITSGVPLLGFDGPTVQFGGFAYLRVDGTTSNTPVLFNNGDLVENNFAQYSYSDRPIEIADVLDVGETGIFGFVIDFPYIQII